MLNKTKFWLTVCLIAASFAITGCHTTNVADIKPGERPASDTDIGGLWYQVEKIEKQIKNSPSRIRDPELNQYIYDIVCDVAGEFCSDIRVYIVDVPAFNASMYPNGMMIVWSGFLLRAQTKDQVASVIGHEVGHYVKQHSLKQMRSAKNLNNLLLGIGMVSSTGGLVSSLAGGALFYKFSRDHERESDEYGLNRLKELGLNPKAAAQIWILVQEEARQYPKSNQPFYLSTHPSTRERIKNLGGSEDMELSKPDPEYLALIEKHYPKWLKREISKRSYNSSEVVLNRLAKANPNNAMVNFYQAELYRRRNEEKDLEKANEHYLSAIRLGYQNPKIYKKLAELSIKRNSNNQAIDNYQKYIEFGGLPIAEQQTIEQKILNLRN